MSDAWQRAPAPALRVPRDTGAADPASLAEANAAARRWAAACAAGDADLLRLAASPDGATVVLGRGRARCVRTVLPDGDVLLWLEPLATRPAPDPLAEHHHLVAEALGVGFWSRNLDEGTGHWDEQMYRLFGRDPAVGPPPEGAWIDLYVHPDDVALLRVLRRRVNERWEPMSEATYRLRDTSRGERWVQCWTRRVVRDGQRLAFGMHMEVTEQRRAQMKLAQERARTEFAIEAAEVGVWERALDGRIVYWSPAMYRMRGLDPADPRPPEAISRDITHPDDAGQWHEQHSPDGMPFRHELRVRRPDGQWRWLVSQGRALRDASGRMQAMVGVNIDITERKRADALRQQKERAERVSRDKSSFMARMSHELRTPMNAVLGFTRLLEEDASEPPSPRQRERLARIGEAGAHMMALVDDLLDLAALEAEPPSPDAPAQPLTDLLAQAVAGQSGLARLHGVVVEPPPADDAVRARVDRQRLAQAVVHLMRHALRELGAGGRLRLRTCAAGQDRVAVVISGDRGAGSAPGNESGLGLTLAQRIAQALGGSVVPSDAGPQGVGYRLEVPGEVADAAGAPPVSVPDAAAGAPLSVLCVEDNPVNLLLVRELLGLRPAVRLHTAEDGRGGIATALPVRPDVLLLDLQLPDMSGLDVLQRLRAESALAGCTFVALSADAMPAHVAAARAAGFDDYWTKPIDFERFLGGIDALAARKAAAARDASAVSPD